MCVDRCVRVSVCSMMCSLCTFCIIFFNEEKNSCTSGEVHFSFSCLWNVSSGIQSLQSNLFCKVFNP